MSKKSPLNSNEQSEKKHFDKMATEYDRNYTYNSDFTQYKIHKKLDLLFSDSSKNKKLKILELGAGTGEYSQHLATLFPKAEIEAIDISPKILEVAKKKCKKFKNIKFKVASAYSLPYAAKSFDIVCGFYILHHLDLDQTMNEVQRVLKPKGEALFYEPNILNPMVLAIKSIPFLKKKVGDSPEEWAINPLQLSHYQELFKKISWSTSEFMVVPQSINSQLAITLDKVISKFGTLPVVNLFGGSVAIKAIKK